MRSSSSEARRSAHEPASLRREPLRRKEHSRRRDVPCISHGINKASTYTAKAPRRSPGLAGTIDPLGRREVRVEHANLVTAEHRASPAPSCETCINSEVEMCPTSPSPRRCAAKPRFGVRRRRAAAFRGRERKRQLALPHAKAASPHRREAVRNGANRMRASTGVGSPLCQAAMHYHDAARHPWQTFF